MQYPSDFTDDLRKKPICGVLAVAMIANVTFARATEAIKNNMLPHQKRHGGKTYFEQRVNALKELGVPCEELTLIGKPTLKNAIASYCDPNETYMIDTSGHCVTVRNGIVWDQYECSPIHQHRSKRCFVRNIAKVLK